LAEWLLERGIGEDRAVLLDGGEIVAAKVEWPGALTAGEIADAVLVSRAAGSTRGAVRFRSGQEALIDRLPRDAREGAPIRVEVTREAIAEAGRMKLAQARATDAEVRPAASLAERLEQHGYTVRALRRFPSDWDELLGEAWEGEIAFAGGTLTVSPTPAMTLIDIDGTLEPRALALAAAPAIARAIGRFELGGSIGIDFPTLAQKVDRKAVDEALAVALMGWPHERTAMNGFGFLQLVGRLERPSLVPRIARDRAGAAARQLLRRAEAVDLPGILLLTTHPAVRSAVRPEWESELARRTGRMLRWHEDPRLAFEAGFAQALAP
jgi:hypothetical protein